jgi:hypothetical protein
MVAQQRRGRHELACLAIAALRHVAIHPGLLQWIQALTAQALDGRDLPAGSRCDRSDAAAHGIAVQVHGAGAA